MEAFVRPTGIFKAIRTFFTRFQTTVHGQHVCGKVNGKRDVFQLAAERWRFASLSLSSREDVGWIGSDRIGSERNGTEYGIRNDWAWTGSGCLRGVCEETSDIRRGSPM